jgi:hypothetical protein
MALKIKKSHRSKGLFNSGVRAVVVVVLVIGAGAFVLPGVFAKEAAPYTCCMSAVTSNDANYAVHVAWSGFSDNGWVGRTYRAGTLTDTWSRANNNPSIDRSGVSCGVSYTYQVAAEGGQGGAASGWSSINAAAPCPAARISLSTNGNTVSTTVTNANFATGYTVRIAGTDGSSAGWGPGALAGT